MNYDIAFKPRAIKDLESFPAAQRRRILAKIEDLKNDLAGDVKRLTDFTPEYRLRVGNYRVFVRGGGRRCRRLPYSEP